MGICQVSEELWGDWLPQPTSCLCTQTAALRISCNLSFKFRTPHSASGTSRLSCHRQDFHGDTFPLNENRQRERSPDAASHPYSKPALKHCPGRPRIGRPAARCSRRSVSAGRFQEAGHRHRLHLEHGDAVQHAHRQAGAAKPRPARTTPAARRSIFNTITISDGISMGTRGHEVLARVARGDRRFDRDGGRAAKASTASSRSAAATRTCPAA